MGSETTTTTAVAVGGEVEAIREAMALLTEYLCCEEGEESGKIPRRKVVMFTEQLGNSLLDQFRAQAAAKTTAQIILVEVKVKGFTSPLVGRAAEAVGIAVEEVLAHLPQCLRLYIQPGAVDFSLGSNGLRQRLRPLQNYDPLNRGDEDASTPRLNVTTAESTTPTAHSFEASARSDVKFTVVSFATTRFGTAKQKSSLALMKQIQANAMRDEAPLAYEGQAKAVSFQEQQPPIHFKATPYAPPLLQPSQALRAHNPIQTSQHNQVWSPDPNALYSPPPAAINKAQRQAFPPNYPQLPNHP